MITLFAFKYSPSYKPHHSI